VDQSKTESEMKGNTHGDSGKIIAKEEKIVIATERLGS
jgi:hypothetical protein